MELNCFISLLLDIEKMVSLKGMVIRCSAIIPEIREAIFRCLVCGYYSDPIVVDRGWLTGLNLLLFALYEFWFLHAKYKF